MLSSISFCKSQIFVLKAYTTTYFQKKQNKTKNFFTQEFEENIIYESRIYKHKTLNLILLMKQKRIREEVLHKTG